MALKNFAQTSLWAFSGLLSRSFCAASPRNYVSVVSAPSLVTIAEKCSLKFSQNSTCAVDARDHTRRHFHRSAACFKREDLSRKQMAASMPKLDEGTLGENLVDITYEQQTGLFPDVNSANRLFNGIRYADLPICNIKSSPNNTIISLCDRNGITKFVHSCGKEGFKNTREGTNIAAQATAITLATRGIEMGMKTVRVTVRGLGPGRMAAIKGLTMGGMDVISITDKTPVPWVLGARPKKRRKL